jgi:predicted TIM-barrel fold metal-dependent hydrolase
MIDFHQHLGHFGRTLEDVIAHQDAHGVRQAVLLPIAGSATPPEHWTFDEAAAAVDRYPDRLILFCHVDPYRPDALDAMRDAHRRGARGFGEHKVRLAVDAPPALAIYRLCAELGWPALLHFEYGNYNYNFAAFEQVLRAHPDTTFIAHAQAWWANVSAGAPSDPLAPGFTAYPAGPVVPGGLSDRWLGEFPNLYGDLSAGSGLNALTRDPEFTRGFLARHQQKLLWATDCPCRDGKGDWGDGRERVCYAAKSLPVLRELCPSPEAFADITQRNARRVLRLGD